MTSHSNFVLTDIDRELIGQTSIVLEDVEDVGEHETNTIEFQFPPIITSDSKSAKWSPLENTLGYEPQYMYAGANPRKIKISATYVVGGPSGGIMGDASIDNIVKQIRTWKSYFYFANFAGGGAAAGKDLPIYRIVWGELLPSGGNPNSAWRAINYSVKYSSEWISADGKTHPLVSTISVDLELATQVQVTKSEGAKQPHPNLKQHAIPAWY